MHASRCRIRSLIFGLLVAASFVCEAKAAVLHESATFAAGSGGNSAHATQYLASRFTLSQTSAITAIGGNIFLFPWLDNELFGAIVALSSAPSALPSFLPSQLSSNTLAYTTFSPPTASSDFRTPLSVTLNAGTYALIFGAGQWDTSGWGSMPFAGQSNLPGSSYFSGHLFTNAWFDGGVTRMRFVVEGSVSPVPLPAALPLFATGLGVMGLLGWRRKRNATAKMLRSTQATVLQLFSAPSRIHCRIASRSQTESRRVPCGMRIFGSARPSSSSIRLLLSGSRAITIGPNFVPFIRPS